jgi:hypothetical protein
MRNKNNTRMGVGVMAMLGRICHQHRHRLSEIGLQELVPKGGPHHVRRVSSRVVLTREFLPNLSDSPKFDDRVARLHRAVREGLYAFTHPGLAIQGFGLSLGRLLDVGELQRLNFSSCLLAVIENMTYAYGRFLGIVKHRPKQVVKLLRLLNERFTQHGGLGHDVILLGINVSSDETNTILKHSNYLVNGGRI